MANVDIVGGEIAVLPEIVRGVDLSGSALGFLTKERLVTGADVKVGDAIIGLRSSGVHSNGLTLARKVLEGANVGLEQRFDRLGGSIGLELLRPTTIYVRDVMRMMEKVKPTGMVDITGGGLKNFVRLKKNVMFSIEDPIRPQPIFEMVQELGGVSDAEMYRTFNMGMGFAVVLRQADVADALRALGDDAKVVGQVTEGSGCGIPELSVHCESY